MSGGYSRLQRGDRSGQEDHWLWLQSKVHAQLSSVQLATEVNEFPSRRPLLTSGLTCRGGCFRQGEGSRMKSTGVA